MSKVSIEREELEDLREIVKHTEPLPGTNVHGRWGRAMSMLDAMIGKGEDHSVCEGCLVDGNCSSQIRVGRDKIHGCTMRVPATPHGIRCGSCGAEFSDNFAAADHCCQQYVTRDTAPRLADSISFQMTASLEAEVKDAVKALAREVVAEAMQEHEEKRHFGDGNTYEVQHCPECRVTRSLLNGYGPTFFHAVGCSKPPLIAGVPRGDSTPSGV